MVGGVAVIGLEDLLGIFQRAVVIAETPAEHGRGIGRCRTGGERDIDQTVGLEGRIEGDAEIAGLAFDIGLRQARNRGWLAAGGKEFEPAFLLGEQEAAIGEESHAPGLFGRRHLFETDTGKSGPSGGRNVRSRRSSGFSAS